MAERRVIVVGGGLIGISCAYYMRRDGWEVELVDAAEPGQACSRGNCGYISLSHVLPLHGPGVIRKTLMAMLRPNSPFSIRPRLDFALWRWLLGFARRCNARDAEQAARGLAALLDSTGKLYDELFEREALACELEHAGCLFVFHDAEHMRGYAKTDAMTRREFGVGAERLEQDALLEFEPALRREACAGGWFYPQDRHLRPDRLVSSWLDKLREMGVSVRGNTAVEQLSTGSAGVRRAVGVRTATGEELEADAVVMAAGAIMPRFGKMLGCRLAIQPGKGYSLTMPRPSICPQRPLIFQDHKVAITPMQSGYRIGSTMEFAGYDTSLNRGRLQMLRDVAGLYLREPESEPIEEEWYGWRSMTEDGLPYIGKSPVWENVWIAGGHNMLGLTMAPVTGKLIAELAGGETPHIDPAPYAVGRG